MSFLNELSKIRTPFLTLFFDQTTYFGSTIVLLVVMCLLYWCVNKKLALQTGITLFASTLVVQALKITFRIPRPWLLDSDFVPVESAVAGATGYSFPSGHTQSCTAVFSSFAFAARKKWVKFSCIALIVVVGFSRMYLGVHTPKDVLAAFVLTLLLSYFIDRWNRKAASDQDRTKIITLLMLLLSAGVLTYALCLSASGSIQLEYALDCCKAAGSGIGFALGYYLESTYIQFSIGASQLWKQILKFILGMLGVLIIEFSMKLLFGSMLIPAVFRYCFILIWIMAGYPALFSRWERSSN